MFEKVNPAHPDKVADRIAGALVDYAYTQDEDPRIAVEVLLGHGKCLIIAETSVHIPKWHVKAVVERIAKLKLKVIYKEVPQDPILADNQDGKIRCGDNGIFRGVPLVDEEKYLAHIAEKIYYDYGCDGKYLIHGKKITICQSNAHAVALIEKLEDGVHDFIINPLGNWRGGINVDSGATNRKLGSDMGRSVTGGGLHGKDLSKADVSVNIYAHLLAQKENRTIALSCSIGDEFVDGKPYREIVEIARQYIHTIGGFEKLAEWGLIR